MRECTSKYLITKLSCIMIDLHKNSNGLSCDSKDSSKLTVRFYMNWPQESKARAWYCQSHSSPFQLFAGCVE
jgi:hypothetical protein